MVSDPGEAGSEGEGCQRSAPSLVATGRAGGEDMVARGAGTCLRTPVLQDQGFPGRGGSEVVVSASGHPPGMAAER